MSRDKPDAAEGAEQARAESFAKLVDGMLDGESIPPALDADDRALLESATRIVASTQELRLSGERARTLVDEALEQAVTAGRRLSTVPGSEGIPIAVEREDTDVIRLSSRRADRVIRTLPWVVAGVAAAAALLLFLTRPAQLGDTIAEGLVTQASSIHLSSRPADPLIGQIAADDAALASQRLDVIYADRMTGFRDLTLSGKKATRR